MRAEPEPVTVWINTSPDINGVYRPTLDVGEDIALFLTQDSASRYAIAILAAVAAAEYDAAVYAQLTKVSGGGEKARAGAAQILADLRADRPPAEPVGPVSVTAGVSAFTGEAFLTVSVNGSPAGQWTSADAHSHVIAVLEAVLVADLDSAYLRLLRSTVGLDEATARRTVDDLARHRSPSQHE